MLLQSEDLLKNLVLFSTKQLSLSWDLNLRFRINYKTVYAIIYGQQQHHKSDLHFNATSTQFTVFSPPASLSTRM